MTMTTLRDGQLLPAARDNYFLKSASIEVIAKDALRLGELAPGLRPSAVFVPWLPREEFEPRLAGVKSIANLGLMPVPHVSARRLSSQNEWRTQLTKLADEAEVTRLLLVGGDPDSPLGPYDDCLKLIRDTDFVSTGIKMIGIAGHPEGHSAMSVQRSIAVLKAKIAALNEQGLSSEIVTQFSFDPDLVANWISDLRNEGIDAPIVIGLPGPAQITTLLRFAARCGVGASAKAVAKYGISLTRMIGQAGPDAFVHRLLQKVGDDKRVRAHIYPFGGFANTAAWLEGLET